LEFKEQTDLFVTNSLQLNAFAISRLEENQPHIININSGIIEKMDDEELKFIIGHEIGHLMSENAQILKLIRFVFPDYNRMPLILRHKIELWQKLSELTADRFGFIASPDLQKCVSGFFKLASGLDTTRIRFDFNAYLKENEKILEFFKKNHATNLATHPINPIRIKSIEAFNQSELFNAIKTNKQIDSDSTLEKEITDLTSILMTLSSSELDYYRNYYIATAGLIAANIDEQMAKEEYERIISFLSMKSIFPRQFLHSLNESGKIQEIFDQSAEFILSKNPGEKYPMLEYLVQIIIADRKIAQKEIEFLYEIGTKSFGLTRKEIAQIIANIIHKEFVPNMYS
ncbi:MAG: M48 family metallopeptidase, partial [Bacteroidales bacterium]|nr:M48 family metallopeptidase [Bacteroidales bacterium]